jgi:hypothetical protein
MSQRTTEAAIAERLDRIEQELHALRAQLRAVPGVNRKGSKKRAFAELYGVWKDLGDLTLDEIKACEYRTPDDVLCS